MSREGSFHWWWTGILREGRWHLLLAIAMIAGEAALFRYLVELPWGIALLLAAWGTAKFWIGREERDYEVEAGPGIWEALQSRFKRLRGRPFPLAPATGWNRAALRHSLSGWVPVYLLCAAIIHTVVAFFL